MRFSLELLRRRSIAAFALGAIAIAPVEAADAPARVRFTATRHPSGGENPFTLCAVELNGDGRPDLAVTHAGSSSVNLLLARPDGGFSAPGESWKVGRRPRGTVAADLDADGRPDLVIAGNESNSVEIVLGIGGARASRKTVPARIAPFNVAVADLNGDGNADIAVANESNVAALEGKGEITILLGDGKGAFSTGALLHAGSNPADVKAADLDADGKTDLVVVNWLSRDLSLFHGRGDGTFADPVVVPYGGVAGYALAVADLDGDGDPDVAVADSGGVVRTFLNGGAARLTLGPTIEAQRGVRSLAVADLNGDGRNDVATANAAADSVTIALAAAAGFATPYHVAVGNHPRNIIAADLNGDGRADLAVTNIEDGDVSVLWNTGPEPLTR